MAESVLTRLWNVVKPPPPAKGAKKPLTAQGRKQRTMILVTLGIFATAGAGWGIYAYISAAPERAQAQFDAAELLMGPAQYSKAIVGFTRAIHTWPQLADAYVERGIAHHYLKEDELALADFDAALQINSSLPRAYAARASIYRDRGDVNRAMDEYGKSIQASPTVDAFFGRGQIYEKLGQHQEAISDYDRAIEYLRNAPHVYRARAFAKANMGDAEGAKSDRDLARSFERQ
jgi:tetratricopeptide (TPR) repeat protein